VPDSHNKVKGMPVHSNLDCNSPVAANSKGMQPDYIRKLGVAKDTQQRVLEALFRVLH
jgi:hypothetical protein